MPQDALCKSGAKALFSILSSHILHMTESFFGELISRPESSTLDFKAELYDLADDTTSLKLAKFLKDVISFCNTIRDQQAYIVFGIKENSDGSKSKIGITESIDDALLQDKLKDKTYPKANFHYYTFQYQKKLFGILEFPLVRYEVPVTATVKLKGIEVGKVYYRQGSMNCEALALETIRINEWQKSLPLIYESKSVISTLSLYLKRLVKEEENVSSILIDLQAIAWQNELKELSEFCSREIAGFRTTANEIDLEINSDEYKYRVQTVKLSLLNVAPNPYRSLSPEQFKFEIEQNENFFDYQFFFPHPIAEIESYLPKIHGIATMQMNGKQVIPSLKNNSKVYLYVFNSNFRNLYKNIKQKAIDMIMCISY